MQRLGTSKLPVEVPGAGELELSGKGVKPVKQEVAGAAAVNLTIKPRRQIARKLDNTGKAVVSVDVTFTPTGGEANSESAKVNLKER